MKKIVCFELLKLILLIPLLIFISGCNPDSKKSVNYDDSTIVEDTSKVRYEKKSDTLVSNELPPPPPPPIPTIKFVPPQVVDEITEYQEPPPEYRSSTKDAGNVEIDMPIEPTYAIEAPNDNKIFAAVEQMPEFIGGEAAMMRYIGNNLRYPESARSYGIEGKVRVKFTVNKNGTISNIHIISRDKLGYGLEEEAIRIIESMPPWKPGKQNGQAVNVYYNLPISFKFN